MFFTKSIEDINGNKLPSDDIRHVRKAARILVIDDQIFNYLDVIRDKYGFSITQVEDIEHIPFVKDYSVILCDIDGVGKGMGCRHGGDLIIELRKSYPLKTIVAYTGHSYSAQFNKFYSVADKVMEKDIELQEWVEELDELCLSLVNPIHQWKKARDYLFKNGVKVEVVSKLEHHFVKGYMSKKGLDKFKDLKVVNGLSEDARNVVIGLVTNMLTRLMIGS